MLSYKYTNFFILCGLISLILFIASLVALIFSCAYSCRPAVKASIVGIIVTLGLMVMSCAAISYIDKHRK